jgi:hypothetical protein
MPVIVLIIMGDVEGSVMQVSGNERIGPRLQEQLDHLDVVVPDGMGQSRVS